MTLHCGDNLAIMRGMEDESIDLIYADPPFNTNRDWGEFDDRFRDMDHYIGWMSERIVEMRRLLKPTGSLYLHCDAHASHYIKVAMDNIFGVKNFNSDIIWRRCGSKGNAKMYSNSVDNILFYSKDRVMTAFNKQYKPLGEVDKYPLVDDIGRYNLRTFLRSKSMGERPNLVYEYKGFTPDKYGWRMVKDKVTALDKEGNMYWNSKGKPYRKIRPDNDDVCGVPMTNIWMDIPHLKSASYPTEKPPALLERIVLSSSNKGDIVLDPFCGSGTFPVAAHTLGRRYIGIDQNPRAIEICRSRLDVPVQQTL